MSLVKIHGQILFALWECKQFAIHVVSLTNNHCQRNSTCGNVTIQEMFKLIEQENSLIVFKQTSGGGQFD